MSIFPTMILLGIDGSEEATLAAQTAIDLANKTGSELHVVYARIPPYSRAFYEGYEEGVDVGAYLQDESEELTRRGQGLLDEQVRKIEAAGGSVAQAHLREGKPEAEIIALAEEIGTGLIVVGSRGLGGIRRAMLGSVSESVVRHAHCPVMVVRARGNGQGAPSSQRILLATEGSEEATLATQAATEIATKTGSELHLVHVSVPP
jgi:nucleotide-binding universal stress UspA family protein